MPKVLSDDQIEAYHRDGFLSPITIMTPEQASEFRDRLQAAEAEWPGIVEGLNRNNAHFELKCLDDLVHHPRVLDVIEDIVGPDILVYATVLFAKEPSGPGFVSWHQDATYAGLVPHDGVTAWIALSPSTVETGCMSMIPGSHKADIAPHHDTFADDNILTRGQEIREVDESKAVDLVLQPGQMSLHHMRTIHGSRPNYGKDRRIGFVIQQYMPPHMRQTSDVNLVQFARGGDPSGYWQDTARPTNDRSSDGMELRRVVNEKQQSILYEGAAKRRNF